METSIRPLPTGDSAAASRVICTAFRRAAVAAGIAEAEILDYERGRGSVEALRAQRNTDRMLAAYQGGDLVGVASTCGNELTKLYVAPASQHRGVGARLFAAAQQAIADAGHAELTAGVVFDAAIPFYLRMGLAPIGRKFDLYGPGPGLNALIMIKRFLAIE